MDCHQRRHDAPPPGDGHWLLCDAGPDCAGARETTRDANRAGAVLRRRTADVCAGDCWPRSGSLTGRPMRRVIAPIRPRRANHLHPTTRRMAARLGWTTAVVGRPGRLRPSAATPLADGSVLDRRALRQPWPRSCCRVACHAWFASAAELLARLVRPAFDVLRNGQLPPTPGATTRLRWT